MSTRVDALRNTLDHLALDPKASEDRRYLVSMLRRLGYSDAEIEAELGPVGGEPGRVIEIEYEGPVEGRAPARSRETTFQVSGPDEGLSFRLADDDGPAGAGVEEVHHTDISGVDSDLGDWGDDFEQGPRDDFTRVDGDAGEAPDDFGAWGDDEGSGDSFSFQEDSEEVVEFRAARRPDPAVAAGWQEAEETADTWGDQPEASWGEPAESEGDLAWAPAETESWQEAEPEAKSAWPEAEETDQTEADTAWAEAGEAEALPEEPAPEQWSDTAPTVAEAEAAQEELVPWPDAEETEADAWPETEEVAQPEEADASAQETEWPQETQEPTLEGAGEPEAPWPETDPAAEDAWEDASWEPVEEAEAPAASPGAYVHGDYTLYTREVHLSTGREQRIYFFAKNTPQSGDPCPLPEGYEVIENDKTGLPFLRRQR